MQILQRFAHNASSVRVFSNFSRYHAGNLAAIGCASSPWSEGRHRGRSFAVSSAAVRFAGCLAAGSIMADGVARAPRSLGGGTRASSLPAIVPGDDAALAWVEQHLQYMRDKKVRCGVIEKAVISLDRSASRPAAPRCHGEAEPADHHVATISRAIAS